MAASPLQRHAAPVPDERAIAAASLARLHETLFAGVPSISLGRQLGEMRAVVGGIFGDPNTSTIRVSGDRPWTLASLADERAFERHYDAVTMALADLFSLKVHLNLIQLHTCFAGFVAGFEENRLPRETPDYQRLIDVVSRLILACTVRPIVSYSALVRDRTNRTAGIVLAYASEITALGLGAAVYAVAIKRLVGTDPSTPLSSLIIENAAALLRRQPTGAAANFRELLQLTTPWA